MPRRAVECRGAGYRRWSRAMAFHIPSHGISTHLAGGPVIAGDLVVAASGDGRIWAMDRETAKRAGRCHPCSASWTVSCARAIRITEHWRSPAPRSSLDRRPGMWSDTTWPANAKSGAIPEGAWFDGVCLHRQCRPRTCPLRVRVSPSLSMLRPASFAGAPTTAARLRLGSSPCRRGRSCQLQAGSVGAADQPEGGTMRRRRIGLLLLCLVSGACSNPTSPTTTTRPGAPRTSVSGRAH